MSRKEIISIRCSKQEKDELLKHIFSIKSMIGNEQNINILLNAISEYHYKLKNNKKLLEEK